MRVEGVFSELLHHKGKYSLLASWGKGAIWKPNAKMSIRFNGKSYPVVALESFRRTTETHRQFWLAFQTTDIVHLNAGDPVFLHLEEDAGR